MTLIVIEGNEAAGKDTHTRLLATACAATRLSFPDYTTDTGRAIHALLTRPYVPDAFLDAGQNAALVLQALMTMNRYEVAPKLAEAASRDIICDRYYLSGVVYGTVEGLSEDWLWTVHARLPQPDLWILLDVSVEESFRRRPQRRDRNERDRNKLERVRDEYLRVFREAGPRRCPEQRFMVVDALGTVDEVQQRIRSVVAAWREERISTGGGR